MIYKYLFRAVYKLRDRNVCENNYDSGMAFLREENLGLNKANKKTKRFVFKKTTDTNDLLSNLLMALLAHW